MTDTPTTCADGATGRNDAAARLDRERDLARYETIVETVTDAVYALDADGIVTLANRAAAELVGVERDDLVGAPLAELVGDDVAASASAMRDELADPGESTGRREVALETPAGEHRIVDVRFTLVEAGGQFDGVVGVARDVTERRTHETTLARHRAKLAALDDLNVLTLDITQAVLHQSTREEVETLVCEQLAAADSYTAAWIGDVDVRRNAVDVRAASGVAACDRDDCRHVQRAIRTGRPRFRRDATDRDCRCSACADSPASAAIPITYDGTLYGVLVVSSAREPSFDADERAVVSRLGDIVGHAINALERKQALIADDLAQLDLVIPGVFEIFDDPPEPEGTITFRRIVPLAPCRFLEYGTVTEDAIPTLRALADSLPDFESITLLDDDGAERRFEAVLSEPPLLSLLAAHGCRVDNGVIEDGDWWLSVAVPPQVDIRSLLDAIRDAYPSIELVAQRRTAPRPTSVDDGSDPLDRLTERQRVALEAAYFGGYFDWPRATTAEELAATLGITAPTLHQHLRTAHRKLLDATLNGPGV